MPRQLILDDHPAQQPAEPAARGHNPRNEELLWLAAQAAPYAGQWVALNGSQLIAHGPDAATVRAAARAACIFPGFVSCFGFSILRTTVSLTPNICASRVCVIPLSRIAQISRQKI